MALDIDWKDKDFFFKKTPREEIFTLFSESKTRKISSLKGMNEKCREYIYFYKMILN